MDNLKKLLQQYIFQACREGLYGVNCSQQCVGHCRDNTVCNHVTGHCGNGCAAGWTGTFCNKGAFKFLTIHKDSKKEKGALITCNYD